MKTRDLQIDNIKGILILLVIFGHALELLRITSPVAAYLYNFIYMFHMPVFIFISGFLAKDLTKGSQKAFRTLFIPFLLFNSLWNIVQITSTYFVTLPLDSPEAFSFLNPGWALWFILALFMWKLLLPDLVKMKNLFAIVFIIGLFSRLFTEFNIFLSLSRLLVFSPYFVGGYLFNRAGLDRLRKIHYAVPLALLVSTLVFNYYFSFFTSFPTEFLWADRAFNFFSAHVITSIFFGLILYFIGFSFVIIFIKFTSKKENFLTRVGQHSFSVYILHTYLIGTISFALIKVNPTLQIVILAIVSIVLAFGLSSSFVHRHFTGILLKIDQFLFKRSH